MKEFIFSVTLKSAITPSLKGLITLILRGVRPSISFASFPTASTSCTAQYGGLWFPSLAFLDLAGVA